MRTLDPAPTSAVDPRTNAPRFGSYRGSIAGVDLRALSPNALSRIARHKHWLYASACTDEVFVAAAVVRLGYSATAFTYVYDAKEGRILAHESRLGPAMAGEVTDDATQGIHADFSAGGGRWSLVKSTEGTVSLDVDVGVVRLRATLDAARAPQSITAVAKIPDGVVNVTEKRTLLATRGTVTVGPRRFSLDGGLGGFDLTQGLLARHTKWRWAFALGRTEDGTPFGMNLVRGFVGELECALWIGDEVIPVGEGVIEFDPSDPRAPWRVRTECGAVELRFVPRDFHREDKRLVVVESRFVQAVGEYEGTLRVPGRAPLRVLRALGVTEDQNTKW
jgi:hypothetical protein